MMRPSPPVLKQRREWSQADLAPPPFRSYEGAVNIDTPADFPRVAPNDTVDVYFLRSPLEEATLHFSLAV